VIDWSANPKDGLSHGRVLRQGTNGWKCMPVVESCRAPFYKQGLSVLLKHTISAMDRPQVQECKMTEREPPNQKADRRG
jgi:hypothetical protein